MKKTDKLFYGHVVSNGHVATILPDKSLQADIFRQMYFGSYCENGHTHEDRQVQMFTDEVFPIKYGKEVIYFIPVIPINSDREPEKVPIPIFMLDLKIQDRFEIINYGIINGYNIADEYFTKPKISVTYGERLERGLEGSDDTDDLNYLETVSEKILQGEKLQTKVPGVKENKHLIPLSDWLKKWQNKNAKN